MKLSFGLIMAVPYALTISFPLVCASEEPVVYEEPISDYDREHWAFQPIRRPNLPEVERQDWPLNPIDHFVLSELERAGLAPAPRVDQVTRLRRLKFDLLGLPPTPTEILDASMEQLRSSCKRQRRELLHGPRLHLRRIASSLQGDWSKLAPHLAVPSEWGWFQSTGQKMNQLSPAPAWLLSIRHDRVRRR